MGFQFNALTGEFDLVGLTFPQLASPPSGTALGSLALPFGDVYANGGDFRLTADALYVFQDFVNFNYGFAVLPASSSFGLFTKVYSEAPDAADAGALGLSLYAATSESTTNNAGFISGLQAGAASALGAGRTTTRLVGGSFYTYNSGFGTVNEAIGELITIGSSSPDGDIGNAFGTYVLFDHTTTTSNTNHAYGHYVNNTTTTAPTIDFVSFYTKTVAGAATDSYAFWSDEQGVFRIKADNTFNSVYQAIPALYNPQFTKYTPGAANFERIVYQWESNVATLTTEKGGTGTLRALNIGDTGVQVQINGKNLTLSGNLVTTGAFNPTFAIPSSSTWTFPSGGGTLSTTTGTVTSIATTSPISGGTITTTGTISLLVNTDHLFTASQSITVSALATSSTDAFVIANTTPATSGVPVQQSGRIRFRSQVWNTTSVAATNTNDFFIESVPVSGGTPSGLLKIGSSLNGASATYPLTLSSAGILTPLSNVQTTGNLLTAQNLGVMNNDGGFANFNAAFGAGASGLRMVGNWGVNWTNQSSGAVSVFAGTVDLSLLRDAAGTMAIRDGTNAQKVRIYNTFTTVDTAGEWFAIDWKTTANVCNLQAVKGSSSGTARVLNISYGGAQASPSAAISIPITSGNITFGGGITLPGGATFLTTNTNLTDGAGVGAGTLATAPSVGNPTKWIGINDNGTTRYIPAW